MTIDFKDILNDNPDNTGNWIMTANVNETRLRNLMRKEPEQLKFTPDGLPIFSQWLSAGVRYTVQMFIKWLQQQLATRSYPLRNIIYDFNSQSGLLKLQFILGNNEIYTTTIFTNNN